MKFNQEKSKDFKSFGSQAVTAYIIIIGFFAICYFQTNSLKTEPNKKDEKVICPNKFDNLYFSFVAFHTIGFGDYSPKNSPGKMLLWGEAIISMIFHTIFSGYFILILIKRYPDIIVSDFVLLGLNDNDNLSVSIRFANKGKNILDAQASLVIYEFKTHRRHPIAVIHNDYYTVLSETTLLLRSDLTKEDMKDTYRKLINAVKNLNKNAGPDYIEVIQLVFSFSGVDEKTGDFVGISKDFTEKKIKFGDVYEKVVEWNGTNPKKRKPPQWNNFNVILNEIDSTKFLESSKLLGN